MSLKKSLLSAIDENNLINRFASAIPRADCSINKTHESDAEIMDLGDPECFFAVTTDQVAEEINTGLYKDPYLMGWMSVIVNLSDLAAVGADPVGLVLSTTLSPDWDDETIEKVIQGISDALKAHGCGSLGGDLNSGEPSLGATALGKVSRNRVMSRIGMKDGDKIYVTGPVGLGGLFALCSLAMPERLSEIFFQPVARLKETAVISTYASSCMDTSDGIIFSLDQLFRLNRAAFHLHTIDSFVHHDVKRFSGELNIPPLAFLCAVHGEFELVFTIPPDREKSFCEVMNQYGYNFLNIGVVEKKENITPGVYIDGKLFPGGTIRYLWDGGMSREKYISSVLNHIECFYETEAEPV